MTINFNSIQWLRFFWKNQFGEVVKKKPNGPSVHGEKIEQGLVSLAKERQVLDYWTPVTKLRFRGGDVFEELGAAALSLRDSFNAWTYGKKKKE